MATAAAIVLVAAGFGAAALGAGPTTASTSSGCPMGIEGATIAVADTSSGADVTVMAPAGRVGELRQRARDAAKLYGPGAHKGLGHHGMHVGAQRHGLRLTELPPMNVRVEDVPGGVRLHLVAKNPDKQAAELRKRMHARAEEVRQGPCEWSVP